MRRIRPSPATTNGEMSAEACRTREQTLLGDVQRVTICRQRLGDPARFMRGLNERM